MQAQKTKILLTPAFLVFATLFVVPLSYFFVVSFWRIRLYKLVQDFSFSNYASVFHEYFHATVFTFFISLIIAIVTTSLAFAIAYLVRFKAGRFGPLILYIAMVTMFGGYLVKIYAWKTILGTNGILNSTMMWLGMIDEPLSWLLYSPVAVVLTLVHFLLPLALLPLVGALKSITDDPILVARDLGASGYRTLVDIILPQCQPGIVSAFALSFLISAGDYVTPRLVGGPDTFMVGNFIESQFVNRLNAPLGAALAFSTLTICLIALALFRILLSRSLTPK
jgi:spermidine/putrescine transport system permease protein